MALVLQTEPITGKRKLLVFAEDKDVAEVAAFGLRTHEGWEPVVATTASQAFKLAHDEAVVGIAVIVVQPGPKVARIVSRLLALSSELTIPFIGITPDPSVQEQFALMGIKTRCIPFDPVKMWIDLRAIA
jgi:methyl coenzyme M reductase subunit C